MPVNLKVETIYECRHEKKHFSGGFTIVETLVAILIFSITLMGSIAIYFNTAQLRSMAVHKRAATEIANAKMEEIRAMTDADYDAAYKLDSPPGPEDFPKSGPEAGPVVGGEIASEIIVRVSDDGAFCFESDYQKVKVIVSWQETFQNSPREVQVASCIYNKS